MVTDADVDAALRQERIRLHLKALPTALVASAAIGGVLAGIVWQVRPGAALNAWLAALLLALLARGAVGFAQRRDAHASEHAAAWLQRHRAALALHGAVWASVTLLAAAEGLSPGVLELMVF